MKVTLFSTFMVILITAIQKVATKCTFSTSKVISISLAMMTGRCGGLSIQIDEIIFLISTSTHKYVLHPKSLCLCPYVLHGQFLGPILRLDSALLQHYFCDMLQ